MCENFCRSSNVAKSAEKRILELLKRLWHAGGLKRAFQPCNVARRKGQHGDAGSSLFSKA